MPTRVEEKTPNDMLKVICKDVNINQEFTNHSMRATRITMLHDSNFPTEQIMTISKDKNLESVKSY